MFSPGARSPADALLQMVAGTAGRGLGCVAAALGQTAAQKVGGAPVVDEAPRGGRQLGRARTRLPVDD